ncbi:hypothetical protein HN748_01850 [Candidatus Peregrinibacteria bacterium]|nr:hypothetical protein [Candidatus Peregrinibacteria bacterium]MBT7702954.1 hypothetical protein [Candidatus Peregrinibacteria bacterium]
MLFARSRRWREEVLTWTLLGYLKGVYQMDRRTMRYRLSSQQPQGVLQITLMSRHVKTAVQDLLKAGLIERVTGVPSGWLDYLFCPSGYTLTEKGKTFMARDPRPTKLPSF